MRILQITREFPPNVLGGVAYHAYHLARAFVAGGHSVTVLTGTNRSHRTDSSAFDFDGITVMELPYSDSPGARLWFDRRVRSRLSRTDLRRRFDVVHSHEYVQFGQLDSLPPVIQKVHINLTEKPRFWTGEGFSSLVRPIARRVGRHILWPRERRLERNALRQSDYRVYISDLTRRIAGAAHEFTDEQYTIAHNGVDGEFFTPADSPSSDHYLYVGGSEPRKGFGVLVDAVERYGSLLDRPVKLVGDFDPDRPDTARAHELDHFDVVGRVDQEALVDFYRRSAALVHPAAYEPFGNVVLESLACGSPTVVSDADHCGAAEILDEAVGSTVSPADCREIVEAMKQIAGCVQSDACRAVATPYTWARVAGATLALVS